jgi:hypothetical protein
MPTRVPIKVLPCTRESDGQYNEILVIDRRPPAGNRCASSDGPTYCLGNGILLTRCPDAETFIDSANDHYRLMPSDEE